MNEFYVINYHITNSCNYHCTYCFGKVNGQKDPTLDDAKKIVDNIALHFAQSNIADGRINFAGGEPTLYEHLDELIDYTSSLGIQVSIVTNGSLLTPERIRSGFFDGFVLPENREKLITAIEIGEQLFKNGLINKYPNYSAQKNLFDKI